MDMNNPWLIDNGHLALRLMLSVFLGALVGYERERKNHAAGLRTHTLVCLGSCLIMILSIYGFSQFANQPYVRLDPARLAAQVVTGVGFLGAGTIMFTGKSITGLTTAASIWVVMAMGLAVGAGFYFPAIITSLLVLLILWGLNIIERRYVKHRKDFTLTLWVKAAFPPVEQLHRLLDARGAKVLSIQFTNMLALTDETKSEAGKIVLKFALPKKEELMFLVDDFNRLEGISSTLAE
jgi:putative Mg2+ transporter-C (MgtC) family protein